MLEILQYSHTRMLQTLKMTVKHSDSISNFVFTLDMQGWGTTV